MKASIDSHKQVVSCFAGLPLYLQLVKNAVSVSTIEQGVSANFSQSAIRVNILLHINVTL